MSRRDNPQSALWFVDAVLLMLIGGHMRAYRWLVFPLDYSGRPIPVYAIDAQADSRWKCVFAPAHWLDRRIRPHVWEPTP